MGLVTSLILTAASITYQMHQARKARKKAKEAQRKAREAADARKGFEVVVEGELRAAPVVYGKAKVGGTRVYHNLSGDFIHANSGSDWSQLVGRNPQPAKDMGFLWNSVQYIIPAHPGTLLNQDYTGTKNEFLFFQQVIAAGPISKVIDVIIDENMGLKDPTLGADVYKDEDGDWATSKAALRIEAFTDGGVADPMVVANFGERRDATFDKLAYVSAVFRLNRDAPQFSDVPSLQFLIEGRTVRTVTAGVLSSTRTYSNNPAWCLLDYLLDTDLGCGIPESQLDLASFEAAAAICAQVVQSNVPVGGQLYQPNTDEFFITQRDLPLYECNIILDPEEPKRDNIEAILGTMGDARLVWSSGRYRLSLQYPLSDAAVQFVATLTDDDIDTASVQIAWPNAEERLNHCTVKFANEVENFRTDTASWPPKTAGSVVRGIGGKRYPLATSQYHWSTDEAAGRFLNDHAVWSGDENATQVSYKIYVYDTDTYELKFTGDDYISLTVLDDLGGQVYQGSSSNWKSITTTNLSLTAGKVYDINIVGQNAENLRGLAATLTRGAYRIWTTRSTTYSSYTTHVYSTTVHDAMLNEDGGMELETEVSLEGVTDYYHALAAAEQLVRTSRSAFSFTFDHIVHNGRFLEPGDFFKLSSETLNLGQTSDLFFIVNECKVHSHTAATVTATRFSWTQQAWSVKDDEYVLPRNLYAVDIRAPLDLTFTAGSTKNPNSIGTLTWSPVDFPELAGYVVYVNHDGALGNDGLPVWEELGRTSNTFFEVPMMDSHNVIFGVRSYSLNGKLSAMTLTSYSSTILLEQYLKPSPITSWSATAYGNENQSVKLSWTLPTLRSDGSDYVDHGQVRVYRANVDDFAQATKIGQVFGTESTEFIDTPTVYGTLYYFVVVVSKHGLSSDPSASRNATISFLNEDLTPPPTATGFALTTSINNIYVQQSAPSYTEGHGHHHTQWYVAEITQANPNPVIGDISAEGSGFGNLFVIPAEPGTTYRVWFRWFSNDGVGSVSYSISYDVTTSEDPAKLLKALEGEITTTQLHQTLITAMDGTNRAVETLKTVVQQIGNDMVATLAQWTVKTDINGRIAGVGLMNDGTEATFEIIADKFGIFHPDALDKLVFGVADGKTVMDGAYITTATITDAHITNLNVDKLIGDIGAFISLYAEYIEVTNANITGDIYSDNFAEGVSGWRLRQDGSAEFNNVSVRGVIEAGTEINAPVINGGIIEGSILSSTILVRKTQANGVWYTYYNPKTYSKNASFIHISQTDTDGARNTYQAKFAALGILPYNAGPSGANNLDHAYYPYIDIVFDVNTDIHGRSGDEQKIWITLHRADTDEQLAAIMTRTSDFRSYTENGVTAKTTPYEAESCNFLGDNCTTYTAYDGIDVTGKYRYYYGGVTYKVYVKIVIEVWRGVYNSGSGTGKVSVNNHNITV